MQIGMIGLGRMGANMVRRLVRGGHQCVVFDRSPKAVNELVEERAVGAGSLVEFVRDRRTSRSAVMQAARCGAFIRSDSPLSQPTSCSPRMYTTCCSS